MGDIFEYGLGSSLFGGGNDDLADASREASEITAEYQREALGYLKDRERLPQQFREGALQQFGGLYRLPGGDPAADARIRQNPMFQATLGQLPQQEEAILRNQSATGALRSGGTDMMLANNQRMNTLNAYQNTLGGLQSLANLPSNAGQIAQQTAGIGQTLGQGVLGAAQTQQAQQQAGFGNMMGLGQLGLAAFGAFCDPALKDNPRKIGKVGGYTIYEWDWNEKAQAMGAVGKGVGPMADEIERFEAERIEIRNGFKYVKPLAGYEAKSKELAECH